MSTSAAAIALSSIAVIEAGKANTAACEALVQGYQHTTAAVEQQQQYAACIDRLHPEALSPDATVALKILVAALLLSVPIGAWYGKRNWGTNSEAVMGALFGFLCVLSAALAIYGVFIGIRFLAS